MNDLTGRYGKYGDFAPTRCAVTGEHLQDGSYTYSLSADFYIRVNPLATVQVNSGFKADLLKVISPPPKKMSKTLSLSDEE